MVGRDITSYDVYVRKLLISLEILSFDGKVMHSTSADIYIRALG